MDEGVPVRFIILLVFRPRKFRPSLAPPLAGSLLLAPTKFIVKVHSIASQRTLALDAHRNISIPVSHNLKKVEFQSSLNQQ